MDSHAPDLPRLFAQLGEPNDEASINRFIERYGHLCGDTQLHEAPFWSPPQAAFLRECLVQDAEWAPVVDVLNVRLHEAGLARACAMERSQP